MHINKAVAHSPLVKSLRNKISQKRKSNESASASPVKKHIAEKPKDQASSSSSSSSNEKLMKMYGLTASDLPQVSKSHGIVLCSDSEVEAVSSQGSSIALEVQHQQANQRACKIWLDSKDMCAKRCTEKCDIEEALMSMGPGGFAFAQFEGSEPVETEMPNLMLVPLV